MTEHIEDGIARHAYAQGEDPVEHAVRRAAIEIEVADEVTVSRLEDPAACPIYGATPTAESTARRIIGRLLTLGWTQPAAQAPAPTKGTAMTAADLHEELGVLLAEGHGHLPVVLTDTDPDGTGAVYEPTEVGLLLGDDDVDWVAIELTATDTAGEASPT
ncbi:hypothetical protein [Nocardiopsis sp. YSL2]|uniref:hypothetical protein n=1 Tax=Nocardiopsis sp. YSL2 TaxID=2939492 RepID=UPI0026F4229B|nr:hypothetical protein [Nocardiopsis sp. YSL2]